MTDERVLRAIAPYGVGVEQGPPGRPDLESAARALIERAAGAGSRGGCVALVSGPSGAGKSSLLHAVVGRLGEAGARVVRADAIRFRGDRVVAGMARRTPLGEWLGCLSRAGLADARLFATRAGDLSAGEAMRLRLALAFARLRAGGPGGSPGSGGRGAGWLVCDEFCSVLDRATAAGVSASLKRWALATGARVIVAGAHEDLNRLVGPDVVARVSPGGSVAIGDGDGRVRAGRVRIERGTIGDYRQLASMHYRGGRPASVSRVLRATVVDGERGRRLAGVLVVAHPTLNGAWREMAWPGRYVVGPSDRARCARRLNREVRRLSRVVVDPRDRGRGVARRLVRAYLDDPLTPATEAVSAMGRLSPFGRSAGMVEYALPPRAADDRLADMLEAMGLEAWELLDRGLVDALRGTRDGALLARELGLWARKVRASVPKPLRDSADVFAYAPLAAGRLCAPPVAYAHAV